MTNDPHTKVPRLRAGVSKRGAHRRAHEHALDKHARRCARAPARHSSLKQKNASLRLELARLREQDGTGRASRQPRSSVDVASTISTPRLESDTGPTAEHRAALARALGWADEAAARGDHASCSRAGTNPGGEERESERRVFTPSATHGEHRLNVWHGQGEARGSHEATRGRPSCDRNQRARPPASPNRADSPFG